EPIVVGDALIQRADAGTILRVRRPLAGRFGAREKDRRLRVRSVLRVVADEVHLEPSIRRHDPQHAADRIHLLVAELPGLAIAVTDQRRNRAGDHIRIVRIHARVVVRRDVTVAIARDAGYTGENFLGHHREVGARLQITPAEAAARSLDVPAFGPRARLARVQLDRAALRVHAGQRTLRAAQDFDALEIEQVERRSGDRAEVDVVDVDADARLDGRALIRLTDAADERAHRVALARG